MVAQHYRWDFIGLSTDTKPTPATSEKVTDGSTFYCSDNSKLYVWYNDQWYEKTVSGGGTTYTAGDNIQISSDNVISATDTTYSNFVGTDGTDAGTAGLVPAPAAADADKFLKSDGTWDTAGGGGPTVVQTTGTSTADVMSQNAVTGTLYADADNKRKLALTTNSNKASAGSYSTSLGTNSLAWGNYSVAIGNSVDVRGTNAVGIGEASLAASGMASSKYAIAIGSEPRVSGTAAIGIGHDAQTSGVYSVVIGDATRGNASGYGVAIGKEATVQQYSPSSIALGAWSSASGQGVMSINLTGTGAGLGYNNSDYRLLTGLYDGQNFHDAATVAQGNTLATSAPTTSTVGVLGQLYTDTTNMHTYQCTAISGDTYTWTQRW